MGRFVFPIPKYDARCDDFDFSPEGLRYVSLPKRRTNIVDRPYKDVNTPKDEIQFVDALMYPAIAGPRNGPMRKVVPLIVISCGWLWLSVIGDGSYQIFIMRGHSISLVIG